MMVGSWAAVLVVTMNSKGTVFVFVPPAGTVP
jgi:hypothetical protein